MFTTNIKEIAINPLHTRIPLPNIPRNQWINLQFDISEYAKVCCKGYLFKTLETICIMPFCKIRKIFVAKNEINENADFAKKILDFPLDVQFINLVMSPLNNKEKLGNDQTQQIKKQPPNNMLMIKKAPVSKQSNNLIPLKVPRAESLEKQDRKSRHELSKNPPPAKRHTSQLGTKRTISKEPSLNEKSPMKTGFSNASKNPSDTTWSNNTKYHRKANSHEPRDLSEPSKNNKKEQNMHKTANSVTRQKETNKKPAIKYNKHQSNKQKPMNIKPKMGGKPPLAKSIKSSKNNDSTQKTQIIEETPPQLKNMKFDQKKPINNPPPPSIIEESIGGSQLNSFNIKGWDTKSEEKDVIDELIEDCCSKRDNENSASPLYFLKFTIMQKEKFLLINETMCQ